MGSGIIAIIDYGAGNLRSVARAIARLGCEPLVTSDYRSIEKAQAVILPGVGAAADAMRRLETLGLKDPLREYILADRPFFGVCLGLQLLFSRSEESGGHECLNILPGTVKRLPDGLKVPHMGWNQVKQRAFHPILEGVPDQAHFYFVHSYYVDPQETAIIVGETEYGLSFGSMVARGNLVGTQFHPEKSGMMGLKVYKNFCKALGKKR